MGACVFAFTLAACSQLAPDSPTDTKGLMPREIAVAMAGQVDAWNRGDIAAFMELGYAPSDTLLFIGSKGLTHGYEVVLANYLQAYPDGAARGRLAFENLEWIQLGDRFGLVVGKWSIEREGEEVDPSGHYSLVWEHLPQGWRIIADHSS